jgi:hypothetical protein
MKKPLEYYIEKLNDKYPNEYLVLISSEEYSKLNSHSKIKFKHLTCNTEFEKSFHGLLRDEKCPYCSTKTASIEKYQKYLDITFGKNEYTILSKEYIGNKTPIKIKHNKCNTTWNILPCNIKDLKSCPTCKINNLKKYSNDKKYTIKEIQQFVDSIDGYQLISKEYNNNKEKIKILHKKCGNIFEIKFNNFQQGYRCSYCNKKSSNIELRVADYLTSLGIDFKQEEIFNNCKYKNPLPFDFRINSNNTFILLECDGEQHFKECLYNKNGIQNKRDKIKDEYCKENNIKLYRIPYTKFNNIEEEIYSILLENNFIS